MRSILIKDNANLTVNTSENIILVGYDSSVSNVILNIKEGMDVNIYGIFILTNGVSITLKTLSNHLEKETKSRVYIKAVLRSGSKFNYEGMINIEDRGTNSDAYLQNENLTLDDDCIVNSSPQLEIKNNLVKASHGVTISTVDKNQLEYLMSRGMNERDATVLLVNGFIEDIASMLSEEMYEQIQKRLSNLF